MDRPQHRRNASSKSGILRALVSSGTPSGLQERAGNIQSPPSSPSNTRKDDDAKASKKGTHKKDGPKKAKSSTNLSAVFAKMNRSSKDLSTLSKDKENTTPPVSAGRPLETPIFAQFASNNSSNSSRPETREAASSIDLQNEIDRYTPKIYSPSKQRNFNGTAEDPSLRPTLGRQRPKSAYAPNQDGIMGALGRKMSGRGSVDEKRRSEETNRKQSPARDGKVSIDKTRILDGNGTDRKTSGSSTEQAPAKEKLNVTKRGGRVMAAVAAFQGKSKDIPAEQMKKEATLDPKEVDAAFEAVLESRNIPEPMRHKMRSLTLRVKADFVKQNNLAGTSPPGCVTNNHKTDTSKVTAQETDSAVEEHDEQDTQSIKRSRTRSRTFTFSKGDRKDKGDASPSKKQRSKSKSRPISVGIPDEQFVNSMQTPTTPTGSLGRKSGAPAAPSDYISYLKKHQDPTKVEVGRIHKLRILLRNETVTWVDGFISQGGMAEIVQLLNRTMAIEWREDHEDQVLHEGLLCLKGLCTTERALTELSKVADDLFPALLAMLFDDEKKGPAEYTTRTIIINVLFNFLAAAHTTASSTSLEKRARQILRCLGEPPKPEDARPVDFVLGMHVPRPYKLWCREVSNVTKEVFWIFLHHLNVIPFPKPSSSHGDVDSEERAKTLQATYTHRHFPGSRPPVPAAPYIGGVEWDATTYMTAHLDLLNGLIASLPDRDSRNVLRGELQASGFEKVMGAVLRTCKEKFYSGVHDGLRAWVAAAAEDGWETKFIREGPTEEEVKEQAMKASPKKSPKKKKDMPPQLDAPKLDPPKLDLLDLKLEQTTTNTADDDDEGWLG